MTPCVHAPGGPEPRQMRSSRLSTHGPKSMPMLSRARGDAPAVRPRASDRGWSVGPGPVKGCFWRHSRRSPGSLSYGRQPVAGLICPLPLVFPVLGRSLIPMLGCIARPVSPRNADFSHPGSLHRSSERWRDRSDAPVRPGSAVWLSGRRCRPPDRDAPPHPMFSPEPPGGVPKPRCSSRSLASLLMPLSVALMLGGAGIGMPLDRASVVEGT
jgi:hypothetical protein